MKLGPFMRFHLAIALMKYLTTLITSTDRSAPQKIPEPRADSAVSLAGGRFQ